MIARYLLAAALVLQPMAVADAACYTDAYGRTVCDAPVRGAIRGLVQRRQAVRAARAANYSMRYAAPATSYRSGGSAAYSAAYAEPVYSAGSHGGYATAYQGGYAVQSAGSQGTYAVQAAPVQMTPVQSQATTTTSAAAGECACGENCQCARDLRDENDRLQRQVDRLEERLDRQQSRATEVPDTFSQQGREAVVPGKFSWQCEAVVPKRFVWQQPEAKPVLVAANYN